MYRRIQDMTWPAPCEAMAQLEWRLRYAHVTINDRLLAASVIQAYMQMIDDPRRKRDFVIRELRMGPNID